MKNNRIAMTLGIIGVVAIFAALAIFLGFFFSDRGEWIHENWSKPFMVLVVISGVSLAISKVISSAPPKE